MGLLRFCFASAALIATASGVDARLHGRLQQRRRLRRLRRQLGGMVPLRFIQTGSDSGADPLGTYFVKDKQGRTIFDYEMIGTTPEDMPPTGSIDTNTDSAADPGAKSTLQVGLEDTLQRQDDLQRYFTGRKVKNDCETFPYCNHIPAPPPVVPPPNDLAAPNPNVWYPWLPRNPSAVAAPPAAGARGAKMFRGAKIFRGAVVDGGAEGNTSPGGISETFHPWYAHRDIGQKWRHDPFWDLPFEKPGVVPRLYNRMYQPYVYEHGIGDLASSPKSGPKIETPPNGPYVESEAAEAEAASEDLSTSKEGIAKTYTSPVRKNAGPGGKPAAAASTTGYQPPNMANQAWDGKDLHDAAVGNVNSPAPGSA